jgi:DNA-binding NarL/FixJ family response regulator
LLADDQRLMLDCLKQAIVRLEPAAEVVTAGSFPEAFRIATDDGKFSVILLDLHMPGMNGLEGLRKAVAAFPETSIAIITGMIHKSVAASALGAGAKGFIPKNISTERLMAP